MASVQDKSRKRVVIVDDSRTMQAIMEQVFSVHLGFDVVGVASDAEAGYEMARAMRPDMVSIDLCMPYIDGGDLLKRLGDLPEMCKIVISSHGLDNVSVVHRLQVLGAHACIAKQDIIADPKNFHRQVEAALVKARRSARPKRPVAPAPAAPGSPAYLMSPPVPLDEQARVEALARFSLANDDTDHRLDLLTEHLRTVTGFPSAMFTFIGRDRAWVKSAAGFPRGSQPRVFAFCSHTICNDGPTVVTNAALYPRFAMHPLVVGEPGVRSYVGVPITAASGTRLGAACLIDVKPRKVTEAVLTNLEEISAIAAAMIDPTPPARLAA